MYMFYKHIYLQSF